MTKIVDILTALQIEQINKPGNYRDSRCLYLQVAGGGDRRLSKCWVFRFVINGRRRHMGLGPFDLVGLEEARTKTLECRKLVREGIDPIAVRQAQKAAAAAEAKKSVTFQHCAQRYIKSHKSAWKNVKHAAQWESTLKTYVYPVIGKLLVREVATTHTLEILEPIWSTKSETASRVRGRIEVILDWATVQGLREGENPARWRGHMSMLLPSKSKVKKVKHHAALPFEEISDFMTDLRQRCAVTAKALEFLILTAARSGEVLNARFSEIKGDIWTIPAERMKAGREHRVPLTKPAQEIIEFCKKHFDGDFIFPGAKSGRPLSNMAMLILLRRMGRPDLTAHGFRSTCRDWVSETTNHDPNVAEMALAHAIGNETEAAYRRGDLFQKRIALMQDWAAYGALKPQSVLNESKFSERQVA